MYYKCASHYYISVSAPVPAEQQHLCTFSRQSVTVALTSELGCAEQWVAQYRGGRRTQEASFDTSHVRCLSLSTTLPAAQTAVYSARLETPAQEADCLTAHRLCVNQWQIQGEAGDGHGPLSPPLVLIEK